ncbi:hypothetical protein LZ32DRAFT_608248 [Colletotrichum eremochloae]|nr:hypothetical protein LZ32DRAFT_608248 [Colletotrichum eremochloae]
MHQSFPAFVGATTSPATCPSSKETRYGPQIPRAPGGLSTTLCLRFRRTGGRLRHGDDIEEYIDNNGLFDASQLHGPLRTSYKELREGQRPL